MVVVPAMPDAGRSTGRPLRDWIRQQHRAGALVLGVCHGARILAGAALLDGRPVTSHGLRLPGLGEDFPGVDWQSGTRYVDDGDIITTGGILSGIDGRLRVVERMLGPARAADTADLIGWRHYRAGGPAPLPPSALAPADLIAALNAGFRWPRPTLGVLLTEGVGEL